MSVCLRPVVLSRLASVVSCACVLSPRLRFEESHLQALQCTGLRPAGKTSQIRSYLWFIRRAGLLRLRVGRRTDLAHTWYGCICTPASENLFNKWRRLLPRWRAMAAPTRPRAQSHQRASCATAVCCASGRATSSMATGAAHVALQEYIQVSHSTAHLRIHIKPHAYASARACACTVHT